MKSHNKGHEPAGDSTAQLYGDQAKMSGKPMVRKIHRGTKRSAHRRKGMKRG